MKSLLIVEDSFDIAEALKDVFLAEGYTVRLANDGREAIAMLDEQVPDLVMTDIMMPVIGGLELLQTMRDEPRFAQVPVVLMSAGRPELPEDPLMTFIGKPFELDRLVELVEQRSGK